METKSFHIGDLISVVTHRLVSPDHIGGVYNVVDYVTGEEHMTHQLPRVVDVVAPWLVGQHPWLGDIEVPAGLRGEEDVYQWLAQAVAEHGERHEVKPMPFGMYVGREPIAEFREKNPNATVIEIES